MRAYLDGEVAPWQRLLIRTHLARCVRCRDVLSRLRETAQEASAMLSAGLPPVDGRDAWARFGTRSHGRAGRTPNRPIAVAGVVAVAAVVTATWILRAPDDAGCDLTPDLSAVGGSQATGRVALRDVCCGDYDGGGYFDDGVLTLSAADESVRFLVVYEDVDGDGAYSSGDIVRYRSSRACPSS